MTPLSGGDGDDHGDGDRRGRLEHAGDADVRGDGAEPFSGGRRARLRTARYDVSDGVFMVDVFECVPGSGRRRADVRGVVVGLAGGERDGVGLDVISVTPLSGGTATITVTATDAGGSNMSAMQTFTVTVANRPPVAKGTLDALSSAGAGWGAVRCRCRMRSRIRTGIR